jgi:hypothetical protein
VDDLPSGPFAVGLVGASRDEQQERRCRMSATPETFDSWRKLANDTGAQLRALYEHLGTWERVDSYLGGALEAERWKQNRPDLEELDTDPDELAGVLDLADYRTGGSDD